MYFLDVFEILHPHTLPGCRVNITRSERQAQRNRDLKYSAIQPKAAHFREDTKKQTWNAKMFSYEWRTKMPFF